MLFMWKFIKWMVKYMKDQFFDEKYLGQSSAAITNNFAKAFRGSIIVDPNIKQQISCVIDVSDSSTITPTINGVLLNAKYSTVGSSSTKSIEMNCAWNKCYAGKVYEFEGDNISQDASFLHSHTAPPLK